MAPGRAIRCEGSEERLPKSIDRRALIRDSLARRRRSPGEIELGVLPPRPEITQVLDGPALPEELLEAPLQEDERGPSTPSERTPGEPMADERTVRILPVDWGRTELLASGALPDMRLLATAPSEAGPQAAGPQPTEPVRTDPGAGSGVGTTATGRDEPDYLLRAVAWMDAHAQEPITMPQVARAAGISLRALQLAFRDHRDTTPKQYLRERRLELARVQMLAGTWTMVKQAALAAGYRSATQFTTDYARRFGEPPSETLRRSDRRRRFS